MATFDELHFVRLTPESYERRRSRFFSDATMRITEVRPHVPTEPGVEPQESLWGYSMMAADGTTHRFLGYELRYADPFDVKLQCLWPNCQTVRMTMRITPNDRRPAITDLGPTAGWLLYTFGYPFGTDLGVCPAHQSVILEGDPALGVKITEGRYRGLSFAISSPGKTLGVAEFPTNTRTLQFPQVPVSDELRAAGRRVADAFEFNRDVGN